MDQTLTPSHRAQGYRAYGRAADAFDAVAWKAPTASRFDSRPANDTPMRPSVAEEWSGLPAWAHIVGGGVIAALLGALLGGALHV